MSTVSEKAKNYKETVKNLHLFDMSCCLPQKDQEALVDFKKYEEVVANLKKTGIEKAVFWDMNGLLTSPEEGNEELIKYTKDYDNCYICPIVAPEMDLKPGQFDKYLDYYKEHKMMAVRMFPTKCKHSMEDWCVGNMLKTLEKRNIPLILWHTEQSWDTVASVAARYPKLKIIIEAIDKKMLYHSRFQMKLIQNFKNIYFGSYNLAQYSFLDTADTETDCRMVFASNYPVSNPDMSLGIITEANISEKTKKFVCHGFAEDILKNIK